MSSSSPAATITTPDAFFGRVLEAWRKRGYSESTIRGYRAWIERHRADCAAVGLDEIETLTQEHAVRLARKYAVKLGLEEPRAFVPAQSALRAFASTLSSMGMPVPRWAVPPPSPFAEVIDLWCKQGYCAGAIRQHLAWMKRHRVHFGAIRPDLLTRRESLRFARSYARQHDLGELAVVHAHSALHAWSKTLRDLGTAVPPWVPDRTPDEFDALLADYRDFRRRLRGVRESSLEVECRHARAFLRSLRRRRRPLSSMTIRDVDQCLLEVGRRVALSTLASVCTSLRSFLRFLHATGQVATNLSGDVEGPRHSRIPDPPRSLPWSDVRRFLTAVDRRSLAGKRDYAAFLLMASYGMGSGEIRGLRLDDIDWCEGTLRVVRAKTGVVTILPLVGPVGEALVSYLRAGPPRPASVRTVFLRAVSPPAPISPMQLRTRFRLHARKAGIAAAVNTHAFRHSHATRQVEAAAPPRVVSEILGHADPSSLSSYARVAVDRLRELCLPLP